MVINSKGLRACNELIDHYDAYDLQKVAESLNEAIVTNHPDVVNNPAGVSFRRTIDSRTRETGKSVMKRKSLFKLAFSLPDNDVCH